MAGPLTNTLKGFATQYQRAVRPSSAADLSQQLGIVGGERHVSAIAVA